MTESAPRGRMARFLGRGARRLSVLGLVTAVALPRTAWSAPRDEHRYETWLAAFVHGSLRKSLWLWFDGHLRLYENFEPTRIIARPGLSWRARPTFFLTAGYGWTPGWPRVDGELRFTDEHQSWQQLMWTPRDEATGNAAILRARIEERWRPSTSRSTGYRLRLMWRGQVPVSDDGRVFFTVWDELFVGLNDSAWGQLAGVDQNRTFVGMGWQFLPSVGRVEVGYFNVWLVRPGPDPVLHTIAINTFWGWPS